MLNQILALTWKDLKIFFKDPGGVTVIFLQPFMFIVVMSFALSGLFGAGEGRPIQILTVNQDRGTQATAILRQLDEMKAFAVETTWEGQPLTHQMAERLIVAGKRNLALVFPPDFCAVLEQDPAARERRTTKVLFIVDPTTSSQFVEPILGTLQGLLERTTYTAMMPKGIDYLFERLAPQAPATQREVFKGQAQEAMSGGLLGGQEPLVTVERTMPAGMRVEKFPDTFQQNVPGYTIYGIFWIVSLLAGSVLQEKREGTFRRLLVAALARTEAQVGGLTVLLLLSLSALGGCFVPRFVMPDWMWTIGLVTPHAWALDAYQDLLVRGYGLLEVLPKVGALAAFAGAFFGIGVWRFRFE